MRKGSARRAGRESTQKTKPFRGLATRCEVCGQIFIKPHPADPETKCEGCRDDNEKQHGLKAHQ